MAVILSFTNRTTGQMGSSDYFGGVLDNTPDVDTRYSYTNVRNQIADDWGLTGETGATVTWDKTTAFVFQVGSNTELRIDAGGIQLDAGTDIGEFSIDGTLAGDSDNAVPTEKAVKTYVDATAFGAGSLWTNTAGTHSTSASTGISMVANGTTVYSTTDLGATFRNDLNGFIFVPNGADGKFILDDNGTDNAIISILCPASTTAKGIIVFGDDGDADVSRIEYDHNTGQFRHDSETSYSFEIADTTRFSLSATQVTGNPTTDWQFDVGGTTILTLDANHGTNGIVTNTEKISLSAADLAALHTTAIVLVADPGVGRFVQLLRVTMHYVFDTAIYNSVVTRIRWAGVTGDSIMEESGLLNLGTSRWFQDVFDRFLSTGDITNNTVVIENDADAGSTGQGTLDVWVTYVILDA